MAFGMHQWFAMAKAERKIRPSAAIRSTAAMGFTVATASASIQNLRLGAAKTYEHQDAHRAW
jgi:hypothetical protein